MQSSPWQTDVRYRKAGPDYDFLQSERSTSAPPPETSFHFGLRNDPIGGDVDSLLRSGFAPDNLHLNSFNNNNSNEQIRNGIHIQYVPVASDSIFLGSETGGSLNSHVSGGQSNQQQQHQLLPPGFSSSDFLSSSAASSSGGPFSTSTSTSISRHFVDRSGTRDAVDRQALGDSIVRSHSAAPTFDGRLSVGPPPGLANRETPLVSNRSSSTTSRDSYLDSYAIDRSHILQLGQRRPASTGVIGDSQGSSSAVLHSLGLGTSGGTSAVRPAAKTLMDLIQEDFPPESPIDAGDLYGSDFGREGTYLERPRTTSPLSSQNMIRDQYVYSRYDDPSRRVVPTGNVGILDSFGQLRLGTGETYSNSRNNTSIASERVRPIPQYSPGQAEGRGQGPVYAPVASHPQPSRPQPLHPGQHIHFDQPGSYTVPRAPAPQAQTSHVQAQVLPSGHAVYVNAPPQQTQYGYATIQYHPHSQQHHIVHQTVPSGMPQSNEPQQQYISIVPIQSGGGHIQSVGPGGTYTYWQPPDGHGQPGGTQTVTILPPGANGVVPIALAHLNNGVEPRQQHQSHQQHPRQTSAPSHQGGRGKEKSGKGRRGGGTTSGRRSGGGGGGGSEAKTHTTSSSTTSSNNINKNTSTSAVSSASLLEEFKAKKNRDWTVNDVKSHVVEFCQDQNGSRFIQQRLEVGDLAEKEIVMHEVLPAVERLRIDVFGNYVVQKLFEFGTPSMKETLRDTMIGEMVQLSLQMYGCRVVQKALECLDESDLPKLLSEFHNNVLNLIHDQNGNHVIQKCIEVMSRKAKSAKEDNEDQRAQFFIEQIDFMVDDVLDNVTSLACHPYGCRVLQRILEYCLEPKKGRALDEISLCHRTLLDDQYGNYVIQHVLQFGRVQDRDMILAIVVENGLLKLARQKFASNVVEKLLKYGNPDQRKAVVREMLKVVNEESGEFVAEGEEGSSVVLLMVRDAYANYVVQTTLDVIPDSDEKILLLEELNAHSAELKNYTFAKHIVTKLGP